MRSDPSRRRTRVLIGTLAATLCFSLVHVSRTDARSLVRVTFPSLDRHDIARERIAIVGWSHGGSTTLATVNARDREVAAFRDKAGAPPFFRAAVAFYPGCGLSMRAGEQWHPAVPTRIHIGALDDWTPAKSCVELGEAMVARG